MQIEKLVELAEELKLVTLRAKEMSIIGFYPNYKNIGDTFHIYSTEVFKELIKNKEYTVQLRESKEYEYVVNVDSVNFMLLTEELLNQKDQKKIANWR